MRSKKNTPSVALLLIVLALPMAASAEYGGLSADGSVRFSTNGLKGTIGFSAETDEDGITTGQMTFSGSDGGPVQDVDGTGGTATGDLRPDLFFKADLDCMSVVRNEAVMSGVITDATRKDYVGRQVVLVVMDNGGGAANSKSRDRLTWGVYQQSEKTWIASDAEAENDAGVGMSWTATDAEREDDQGRQSDRRESMTCKNIPLSAFSLIEVKQGEGDIRVRS